MRLHTYFEALQDRGNLKHAEQFHVLVPDKKVHLRW